MNFKTLSLSLALISLLSCNNNKPREENDWAQFSKEVIKQIINHNVEIPDTLDLFQESVQSTHRHLKIFFCIDIECSTCHVKLNYWNKIYDRIKNDHDIEISIIAVVSSEHDISLTSEFISSRWQHEWMFDPDGDFAFANKLEDDRFQTILVDTDNMIILVGNPQYNPQLEKLYEQTIIQYTTKSEHTVCNRNVHTDI